MFKSFNKFTEFCKKVANEQNTMVEFKEYPEYRFGTASFMTDKFGGTYCHFKFDYDTLEIIDDFDAKITHYTTIGDIVNHITEHRKNEEELRDLDYIYESINAEY